MWAGLFLAGLCGTLLPGGCGPGVPSDGLFPNANDATGGSDPGDANGADGSDGASDATDGSNAGANDSADGNDNAGSTNDNGFTDTSDQGDDALAPGSLMTSAHRLDFGSTQDVRTLILENEGEAPLDFVIAGDSDWVTTDVSSGQLVAGDPQSVVVRVSRQDMTPGALRGFLTISAGGQASAEIEVRAVVESVSEDEIPQDAVGGDLESPLTLIDFDTVFDLYPLEVLRHGDAAVDYFTESDADWLTISPAHGTIDGASELFLLSADRSGLGPGVHFTAARILPVGGDAINLAVRLDMGGSSGTGMQGITAVRLSANVLDFGETMGARSLLIRYIGDGSLTFQVTAEAPWIALEDTSGTSAGQYRAVRVLVDRSGLATGAYESPLRIATNFGDLTVPVRVTVADPSAVDPANLHVSHEAVDFGASTARRTILVRHVGGPAHFTLADNAAWATPSALEGDNDGEYDAIELVVDRTALAAGDYSGQLTVSCDTGESQNVALSMSVPAGGAAAEPAVGLSVDVLDFGTSATARTFSLHNRGASPLGYAIAGGAEWIVPSPSSGTLDASDDTITVTIDRDYLFIGPAQSTVTVEFGNGESETVLVLAERPEPLPQYTTRIIPWLEVNTDDPDEFEEAVAGLLIWKRITDTAVVTTTPGHHYLYPQLMARVKGMKFIPGVKTINALGAMNFDYLPGWLQIARDVDEMCASSGSNTIILENESALEEYWWGGFNMDLAQLRAGLNYLPTERQIIWYPGMHGGQTAFQQNRSTKLFEAVEDTLFDTRFADQSRAHPLWVNYPEQIWNRTTAERIGEQPLFPLVYFETFNEMTWWDYGGVFEIMTYFDGGELMFYPGATRWISGAQILTDLLLGT